MENGHVEAIWQALCEGFMKAKADGDLLMNLDRAPLLLVDGTAIAQSKTIERYLARRVGLYGANEVEAAQIDAIGEHIRDMKEMHGKAADKAVFKSETLPAFLGKLEKVAGSTKGCLVGKSLSLADIQLYEVVCEYFRRARRTKVRKMVALPAPAGLRAARRRYSRIAQSSQRAWWL